jgi:hypothetical protein
VAALKNKDRQAYDSVVVPSGFADSLFEFAVAAERFKKKMIEAQGEVGWRNFQDSEGARITLAYHDLIMEQIKFETDGDTAKGRTPEGDEALHMVRKNGRWHFDLEASYSADPTNAGMTAQSFSEALGKMAKIIREYETKIGDTTVDELDKEMGEAFFAALLSAGAKPKVTIHPSPSDTKKD